MEINKSLPSRVYESLIIFCFIEKQYSEKSLLCNIGATQKSKRDLLEKICSACFFIVISLKDKYYHLGYETDRQIIENQ